MHEPQVPVDVTCPSHLPDEARPVWKAVVVALAAAGTLAEESLVSIERYCTYYARWRQAEAILSAEGIVVRARRTGVPSVNIWLGISRAAASQLSKLEAELGLVPARRSRTSRASRPLLCDGSPAPRTALEELLRANEVG